MADERSKVVRTGVVPTRLLAEERLKVMRLERIIETAIRTLSGDQDNAIDWETAGDVLQSWIAGHDERREEAMADASLWRILIASDEWFMFRGQQIRGADAFRAAVEHFREQVAQTPGK